jgi:hypothetical protein
MVAFFKQSSSADNTAELTSGYHGSIVRRKCANIQRAGLVCGEADMVICFDN